MIRTMILLACAAGLAGCASNEPAGSVADATDKPKTKRECTYSKSTGSRLGDRVCRNVPVTE